MKFILLFLMLSLIVSCASKNPFNTPESTITTLEKDYQDYYNILNITRLTGNSSFCEKVPENLASIGYKMECYSHMGECDKVNQSDGRFYCIQGVQRFGIACNVPESYGKIEKIRVMCEGSLNIAKLRNNTNQSICEEMHGGLGEVAYRLVDFYIEIIAFLILLN